MVFPNLSSVLSGFHPENFLKDQGEFVKPEASMPFSAGLCVTTLSHCFRQITLRHRPLCSAVVNYSRPVPIIVNYISVLLH